MLDVAPFVGVNLDDLEHARRRLAEHEAQFDRALGSSRRRELAHLMANDVAKLAEAFKRMARAVERGGNA
jgi:hypothetical protein